MNEFKIVGTHISLSIGDLILFCGVTRDHEPVFLVFPS